MKRLRLIETAAELAREAWAFCARYPAALLVAVGVLARLTAFLANPGYWLDEASLAHAIRETRLSHPVAPIQSNQLAPVGFLAIERAALQLLGDSKPSLRLVPLLGGLASVWLFRGLAERCLNRRAALLALAMFVVSDDLIGFSVELKPYATDVALALFCTRLALSWEPLPRPTLRLAIVGAVAAWFSFPVTFILIGVGLVLAGCSAVQRDWRALYPLGLLALIWSASLAGVQWAAHRQLMDPRGMHVFWDFASPGRPVTAARLIEWAGRTLAYLFANPMDLFIPGIGWTIPALAGLSFFLVGCVTMARRDPRTFGLLIAPLGLTLLAASLRLYPCHGRLALFLVPTLIVLVAEGADRAAGASGGRAAWRMAIVWLVLLPASLSLFDLVDPHGGAIHNHHGDRRPYWLEPGRFPF